MIIRLTLYGGLNDTYTYVNTDKIRCFYKEDEYTCLRMEEDHEIYVIEDPKFIQYIINESYSVANSGRLYSSFLNRLATDYLMKVGENNNDDIRNIF